MEKSPMSKRNLSVALEPIEVGKVVYLPLASTTSGSTSPAKLVLRLLLKNNEGQAVRINDISESFPGSASGSCRCTSSSRRGHGAVWSETSAGSKSGVARAEDRLRARATEEALFGGMEDPGLHTRWGQGRLGYVHPGDHTEGGMRWPR